MNPDTSGEDRGTLCEVVRRRLRKFDIPSVKDPTGDGGPASDDVSWDVAIDDSNACSVSAVVAIAFTFAGEVDAAARVGNLAAENFDDVDPREAREPGRRGVGACGLWVCGVEFAC